MQANSFFTVDSQPITFEQALKYLQSSGEMGNFVGEILRQHILEQELLSREELQINPVIIEQAIINFRLEQQLTEPKVFEQWLTSNNLTYESFHHRFEKGFQLERLKDEITLPKLQEVFIEKKIFLDRVVLSRLIVENQELLEELKTQIEEGEASFEKLVQEYSITEDKIFNGMMGLLSRGQLPDELRAAVDLASPGDLMGPIEIEKNWCLFRMEQCISASLSDEQLKETLKNEIFEQWLTQKIQEKEVQLTM
ncbi:peptidylprolyl isomerase [Mastigocoleus sp. MO_188.B34]|uniref:peptidylprolyl isomerase n=1 Tax=Mastigocoleus sp. MO_188.B34 TaxID=3036635 RepID=UPI00262DBAD6|nr:peptidylprolyl isomerase [Mastigocoleus sp. MO_188.B34]MDJ0696984.1 peptidylprolyl isomerase [Mastigocoleus sp. MO_188.B34]